MCGEAFEDEKAGLLLAAHNEQQVQFWAKGRGHFRLHTHCSPVPGSAARRAPAAV